MSPHISWQKSEKPLAYFFKYSSVPNISKSISLKTQYLHNQVDTGREDDEYLLKMTRHI